MEKLREAFRIMFGSEPSDLANWQIAERVMENFNFPLLGERLAALCLCAVVNNPAIVYPDIETTQRIVGPAEDFLLEMYSGIFPLPDELHMDQAAYLERVLNGETFS